MRWGDKRVYWFIVLARGKVRFVVMPDWWSQTGEGSRMQRIVAHVNKCVDLVGICCEYLVRLEALVDKKGDRLRN